MKTNKPAIKIPPTGKTEPVVRPPRFFVQLKGYGCCRKNGGVSMAVERSAAKLIAPEDAPIALVVAMLEEMQVFWKYSTVEAGQNDIQRLRDFVENMDVT